MSWKNQQRVRCYSHMIILPCAFCDRAARDKPDARIRAGLLALSRVAVWVWMEGFWQSGGRGRRIVDADLIQTCRAAALLEAINTRRLLVAYPEEPR
jgi:hypothetical protein